MKMKYSILIITVIYFNFYFCNVASSSNILNQGEFLNSSTFLISANKLFVLGFFSPEETDRGYTEDTNNTYLGIGFTGSPEIDGVDLGILLVRYHVWVGNRNEPIQKNSLGILSLTNTGDLIITHDGGDPIRLYSSGSNLSTTATLTNSGNFILSDEVNTTLWQSFDHPTDTLLPGMKLGQNMSLTSWYDKINPSEGPFTLEWNSTGSCLDLKNHGVVHWSSGALIDGNFEYITTYGTFSLDQNYIYHDGEYFSYSRRTNMSNNDNSRWVLGDDGSLVVSPSGPVVLGDLCKGYKKENPKNEEFGCQLFEQPTCRNDRSNFSLRTGDFGFHTRFNVTSNVSFGDCRSGCWNDCECVGFQYQLSAECGIFKANNFEFDQDMEGRNRPFYVLFSNELVPTVTRKSNKARRKMQIVIGSIFCFILLGSGCLSYWGMRHMKKAKKRKQEEFLFELATSDNSENGNKTNKSGRKGRDVKMFTFSELVEATNNFSVHNKLGQGGFGLVYKGKLSDGREIAIKRLSKTSSQGVLEFKNELILIAKLQHKNLVRVLGCCIHKDEKMLAYEYMPNKSLDSFLFDATKKVQLDWKMRLNIIEGIGQGLIYLHKYSRMQVIHRDLKAGNVLLDEHMNPKIADFGMARIFLKDETEAMTDRIVGTHGYMSPEYVMGGTFSVKSDVFSFGVLTLEIVSGRRNSSFYHLDKLFNLIGFAWMLWKDGEALQLKDETLIIQDSDDVNKLLRTIQVGLLCVQENATSRPDMSDVIAMLSNDAMPLPVPLKPAFYTQQDSSEVALVRKESISNNYMSMSILEARL